MFPSYIFPCVLSWAALTQAVTFSVSTTPQPISLGVASTYSLLAATRITNTGLSEITGNIAIYPGQPNPLTGFPPGTYTGTDATSDVAVSVVVAASTAFQEATNLPCGTNLAGQDLGGMILSPGVYCLQSATLTGTLILNAAGATDAQFIFQIAASLEVVPGSLVLLANGAQACNVFWAASVSIVLGGDTSFVGNVISEGSITANNDVISNGGFFSLNNQVTLYSAIVNALGNCASGSTTTSTTTSSTTSTTTTTAPTTSSTMVVCLADNCLRAFRATQTPGRLQTAQAYCASYTTTTSHSSTPTWVPAECTASRISSVCSCIGQAAPSTTSTTTTTTTTTPHLVPTTPP